MVYRLLRVRLGALGDVMRMRGLLSGGCGREEVPSASPTRGAQTSHCAS